MSNGLTKNTEIRVRDKVIGRGQPVFIIAEIGANHNGNLDLAKKTIVAAVHAGADAVKFQMRDLAEVFTKEMLEKPQTHSTILGKTYGEYRKTLELTKEALEELRDFSHSLGLVFFVTPFDLNSAKALAGLGMDMWKIASMDLTHKALVDFVAKRTEPIFLSTGMATPEEIDEAIKHILKYNHQLIVNHCVSIYPTPDEDLNLGAITTMLARYPNLPIGYSGHEVGYIPTIAAVVLGACAVERHFTLNKALPGPDHSTVSLDVPEFSEMARQIRRIEAGVRDSAIYLHDKELAMRNKHGKSVTSRVAIPAGTVITASMLTAKSPGHGIKPYLIDTVVGRKAKTHISEDTTIIEEHLV